MEGLAPMTAEPCHWDAEEVLLLAPGATVGRLSGLPGADGSEAGKVDAAPPTPRFQCETCHNDKTLHDQRHLPSGSLRTPGLDALLCHQGRESTVSVNKLIADVKADDPDKTRRQ
jgi:hypothetical protein